MKKKRSKIISSLSVSLCILLFTIIVVSLYVTTHYEKDHIGEKVTPEHKGEIARPSKKLAIVIDDIGYDDSAIEKLLTFDIPITFSILPYCPYSEVAARKARRAGREVILHIPMEPQGYPEKNPGEGALLISMTRQEIEDEIQHAIDSVPFISGANNHMGSRFMADEEKLEVVLAELKKRDLYFLDSVTTTQSKGKTAARKIGIAYGTRDIFIDNSHETEETATTLKHIIKKQDKWETLIAIGHPYKSTLAAIEQVLPELKKNRIKVVPLSEIIRH